MRSLVIISIICFGSIMPVSACIDSDHEKEPGNLFLSIKSISFFKNNEYYNPLVEGYTLTGYFFQPELVYLPSEKVLLKAGAHLLGYSGINRYSMVKPLFSVTYNLSEKSRFVIGSLPGSGSHRMLDPHFNKERLYNENSEDGVGFTMQNDNLFTDAWLSWENFIFKGDREREIFTAGESFRYTSPLFLNRIRVEIPLQIQFKHYGGQISNYPEPVETYLNAAAGLKIYGVSETARQMQAGIDALLFNGRELSGKSVTGINHGNAGWFRLFCSYSCAALEAGYWVSNNFYAPNGNFIFGSVSNYQDNTVIADRKMLTFSATIDLMPENFLSVFLGFDGYYDTALKRLDHSLTLHLRFDKLIRLSQIRP